MRPLARTAAPWIALATCALAVGCGEPHGHPAPYHETTLVSRDSLDGFVTEDGFVETRAASRFDNGSSNRNAEGLRTMARPMATRWRWPPESCPGRRSR